MAALTYQKSIGMGAGFPIELVTLDDNTTSWRPLFGDPDLIKQSLTAILTWKVTERFRQEYFGTRIWEVLEEPNTPAFAFILRRFIIDGIKVWEPRVEMQSVNVYQKGQSIVMTLVYSIANTENLFQLDFTYNPALDNSNV